MNWFERKRSRALALAQMGFAVGGAFTFLVGLALHQFGWRTTSILSAGLTLLVILPLSRHFDKRPEDIGQFVDGIDPKTIDDRLPSLPPTVSLVHFTASEALRTRAFWFISLGHASALLVVGASMAHLGLYLEEERTFSTLHTAIVVGMLPAMMGVGQLLGGILGDRFDKRLMVTVAMLGHGLGMLPARPGHQLGARLAVRSVPRLGLGRQRVDPIGDAGRLLRCDSVRQDHGVLVDDRDDGYGRRPDRGRRAEGSHR